MKNNRTRANSYDTHKKMLKILREFSNDSNDVNLSSNTDIKVVGSDNPEIKSKISSIFNDVGDQFMNGIDNMVVSVEDGYLVITFDLILSGNNVRVMVNSTEGTPVLQFVNNSTLSLDTATYNQLTAIIRAFNPKVMAELNGGV